MFHIHEHGIRWGYTFLRADSRLSPSTIDDLLRVATEMYIDDMEERRVNKSEYEGIISTEGKYDSLGCFGGQRFDAEIQTNGGKVHVRFLVNEQSGREKNAGYVN